DFYYKNKNVRNAILLFRLEQRRSRGKGILQPSPGKTGTEINKNRVQPVGGSNDEDHARTYSRTASRHHVDPSCQRRWHPRWIRLPARLVRCASDPELRWRWIRIWPSLRSRAPCAPLIS